MVLKKSITILINILIMDTRTVTERLVKKYGSGNLLDIGAGYGRYRDMLLPLVTRYFSSDKFDTNADFIEDASALTHKKESFDTVLCNQTLEHGENPELMVKEMHRVLKKGGHVIATVPFLFPEHEDPTDFRRYTRSGFTQLFLKSGFTIVECKSYGGIMSVVAEFIRMGTRNPYKPPRGAVVRKTGYLLSRFFEFLDSKSKNQISESSIYYSNLYIVARK